MLPWLPPYRIELETWGSEFGDLATGSGGDWDFLVSGRLRDLVAEHGLTGLDGFEPVEVVRVRRRKRMRESTPPYYLVKVRNGTTTIDEASSEFERRGDRPICSDCGIGSEVLRYRRLIVSRGTWDGLDVFTAHGHSAYLVSERFKNLCEQAKLRNVILIPADSELAGRDWYPNRNMKRAKELMSLPLSDVLVEKVLSDGRKVRYYFPINELVIQDPDGQLAMDRPFSGREYWDELK